MFSIFTAKKRIVLIDKDFLRVEKLADLDLDYEELRNEFETLSTLAAKVAGTELSEVNLIDNFTQWTVAGTMNEFSQKPREESICNFTIDEDRYFKARVDLDPRFKHSDYVKNEGYKFYYGIPLKLNDDVAIGTLCVGGKNIEDLNDSQIEQLHLIARQIVKHISLKYESRKFQLQALDEKLLKLRLAHDIRSPLSGISQLIEINDFKNQTPAELHDLIHLIATTSSGILQLTNDILKDNFEKETDSKIEPQFTLSSLALKLKELYNPQAKAKNISLNIQYKDTKHQFPRRSLLPLIGNLISNAIKFTKSDEEVKVNLAISEKNKTTSLQIHVEDTGIGMSKEQIDAILLTKAPKKMGTSGELGFGMGLRFVKELISNLNGVLNIKSTPNEGTDVHLEIPLKM